MHEIRVPDRERRELRRRVRHLALRVRQPHGLAPIEQRIRLVVAWIREVRAHVGLLADEALLDVLVVAVREPPGALRLGFNGLLGTRIGSC